MVKRKKILYLISHAGGGHRTAADAIETAIKELKGDDAFEHKIVDIWTLGDKRMQFFGNKVYDFYVKYIPFIYGFGFWITNISPLFDIFRNKIYKKINKGLKELIKFEEPDGIVTVHPGANHALFKILDKPNLGNKIQTANVVIELVTIHRSWTEPKEFDLIVVATKEAKEQFKKQSHPEGKIKLIGPLVRPQFLRDYGSKQEIRTKEGLDPDKFTVMVMGGAVGYGRICEIVKELDKLNKDIQIITLVSKNKEVIEELKKCNLKCSIKTFGFTPRVPQLMKASDILITKAGSVTLSEALACNVPVIIDSYIPGQESGNPPWVEKNKFGRFIKNPKKIAQTVAEWIETGKHNEYRENIKKFFNPRSTFLIAEEILKLIE